MLLLENFKSLILFHFKVFLEIKLHQQFLLNMYFLQNSVKNFAINNIFKIIWNYIKDYLF